MFGLAVAANALGGLAFHGVQGGAARWVHDIALVAVLLFIAVFAAARTLERSTAWTMTVYAVGLAAVALLLAASPDATDAISVVLALGIGALELAEYRHELPRIRAEGFTARRLARLSVLAALALAATAFLVGRTGAAWCRPDSAFQWHAVWHVLSAVAMALYAYGAIAPHPAALDRRA